MLLFIERLGISTYLVCLVPIQLLLNQHPRMSLSSYNLSILAENFDVVRYSVFKEQISSGLPDSGDKGIRTLDPLLARQVLSQLSYTPIKNGILLCSHTVTSVVFSADHVLTVVFGMGTGVTHDRIDTGQIIVSSF